MNNRAGLRWVDADIWLLENAAGSIPAETLARYLQRDVEAVHIKASRLGLSLLTHKCKRGHDMVLRGNRYRCLVCRRKSK